MTVDLLRKGHLCRQELGVKPPSSPPGKLPAAVPDAEPLAEQDFFKVAYAYVSHSLRRHGVPARHRRDLAQEVLAAAFRKRDDYDPELGSPSAWLGGFVVNVVRSFRRAEKRREQLVRELAEEAGTMVTPDEAGEVMEERRRILVDELLPQVPFDQRAVVIARDLDELEMRDIAEQQGIPLSTAYDRYERGRAALARAYKKWQSRQRALGLIVIPATLEQLLEADRTIPALPADEMEAAWRRFRRRLFWDALLAFVRRPAVKQALTFAAGGVTGAVLYAALSHRTPAVVSILPVPPPVIAAEEANAAPAPSAVAPPPPPGAASVIAGEAATPHSTRATPIATAVPLPSASAPVSPAAPSATAQIAGDANEESRLFEAACRAFDRGDLDAAEAAIKAHEHDYPEGDFTSEREALRVKVLVQRGRPAEARARLDHLRETPGGRAIGARLEPTMPDAGPPPNPP